MDEAQIKVLVAELFEMIGRLAKVLQSEGGESLSSIECDCFTRAETLCHQATKARLRRPLNSREEG